MTSVQGPGSARGRRSPFQRRNPSRAKAAFPLPMLSRCNLVLSLRVAMRLLQVHRTCQLTERPLFSNIVWSALLKLLLGKSLSEQ